MLIIITLEPITGSDRVVFVAPRASTPEDALARVRAWLTETHDPETAADNMAGHIILDAYDDDVVPGTATMRQAVPTGDWDDLIYLGHPVIEDEGLDLNEVLFAIEEVEPKIVATGIDNVSLHVYQILSVGRLGFTVAIPTGEYQNPEPMLFEGWLSPEELAYDYAAQTQLDDLDVNIEAGGDAAEAYAAR